MPESTPVVGSELDPATAKGAAQLPSALRSVVAIAFSGSPVTVVWMPL